MLRLTNTEYEIIAENAKVASLPLAEYAVSFYLFLVVPFYSSFQNKDISIYKADLKISGGNTIKKFMDFS